VVDDSGDRTGS